MKKDNFVLNLCRCLSDSLLHSLSNSIWHCWKRFQRQIWILYLPVCPTAPMQNQVKQNHAKVSPSTTKYGQARPTTPRYHQSAQNMIFKKHLQKERKKMKTVSKVASMRQALEASKNKEVDCYNLQHFLDQKNNVIRPNTNFRMLTFSTFETWSFNNIVLDFWSSLLNELLQTKK